MSGRASVLRAVAPLAMALVAVACTMDLQALSPFPCATDGTCPSGLTCNGSKTCVANAAGTAAVPTTRPGVSWCCPAALSTTTCEGKHACCSCPPGTGLAGERVREGYDCDTNRPCASDNNPDGATDTPDGGADRPDGADGATEVPDGSGLVAHWTFDEGAGTSVMDSGPHALNGIIVGGAGSWTSGPVGNALVLDGSAYVALPGSSEKLNPHRRDWTVAVWVQTSASSGRDRQPVFGKQASNSPGGHDLVLEVATRNGAGEVPGTAGFWASGYTYAIPCNSRTLVNDGAWHHLAGVRSGNDLRLYVDGNLEASVTDSSIGDMATSADAQIGNYGLWDGWASTRFAGAIDDLRVYERALDGADVAALALP